MENENMEKELQDNETDILENQKSGKDVPPSDIPDNEVGEDVPQTSDEILENENSEVSSVVDENEVELLDPEITGNETNMETDILDGDSGDFVGDGFNSYTPDTYVTNVYEVVEDPAVPFWDSSLAELSTTDTLLFLIFILLLAQFIHNIFKGSHWFKG